MKESNGMNHVDTLEDLIEEVFISSLNGETEMSEAEKNAFLEGFDLGLSYVENQCYD